MLLLLQCLPLLLDQGVYPPGVLAAGRCLKPTILAPICSLPAAAPEPLTCPGR